MFDILMKHILPLLFALCLSISGCGFVLKTVYGVKQPKPRTEQYLIKFLQKQGIDTTNLYSYSYPKWGQTLSVEPQLRFPDIFVFDKQGRYIPYSPDGKWICKSNVAPFIEQLADTAVYDVDSSRSRSEMLSNLYSFRGEEVVFSPAPETDFVVVVIWASFIGGRLAKENIPEWERQATDNPHANIELIKISLDLQAWWPELDTLEFGKAGRIEWE